MSSEASSLLQKQFKSIQQDPSSGFSAVLINNDIFKWRVTIVGPPGTPYDGGIFTAILTFPEDFPLNPPKMKFLCPMYHPNISETGEVCISILDPSENEIQSYERSDRWQPAHTVESLLLSVISMLSDPICESPENLDAAKTFRSDKQEFLRKVRRTVEQSHEFC